MAYPANIKMGWAEAILAWLSNRLPDAPKVGLADKIAGEDLTNDLLRVQAVGGAQGLLHYSGNQLFTGIESAHIATNAAVVSNWVDVAGYRNIAVYLRFSGTWAGTGKYIGIYGSPLAASASQANWVPNQNWLALSSALGADPGKLRLSCTGIIANAACIQVPSIAADYYIEEAHLLALP